MTRVPEPEIARVMADTGMQRMQAINHLRQRYALQQQMQHRSNEYDPTFQLEKRVAVARKEMGEARWNELQREWGE